MAYVQPGSSRRLTKTFSQVQARQSLPRWAAVSIVISPLVWLICVVAAGIAFSGFAHLAIGAILFVVGALALAMPAAVYCHGFLGRIATYGASFVGTLTGCLAVAPAWLAVFGRATRAVVTSVQATPGCVTRNSGCYGDVRLTLRAVNGSALPGRLSLSSPDGVHVGSVLVVKADPLGIISPALHPSAGTSIALFIVTIVMLGAIGRQLASSQRAGYRSLLHLPPAAA